MKFLGFPAIVAVALLTSTIAAQATTVPKLSDLTKSTTKSTSSSSTSVFSVSDTATGSDSSTGTRSIPKITGTATATSGGGLTGLPKLSGAYSYPPATVPPTQMAPYMQISSMPEGTVFIAVGAILGFAALMTLAWRGLIAWSLHRSVKRAAIQQQLSDNKTQFALGTAPMHRYTDRESTIDAALRGKRNTKLQTSGHAPAASQSLFFSPTASTGVTGTGTGVTNRGSNYLPAGYYAAGASAPGGGQGMTTIGGASGSRDSIGLMNMRPQSQSFTPGRGVSPPDSPAAYPQHHRAGNLSTSTVDLNPRTTTSRAPSAYFDDMLDESSGAPRPPSHGAGF